MHYALIIAGGSGTRLWPMGRAAEPKQLIPFIKGQTLLAIAFDRLDGLLPPAQRYICAGETHRAAIFAGLPNLLEANFLGEPVGRDTFNAVALSAAIIAKRDPDAVIAVLSADHIIEPVEEFQRAVATGLSVAEQSPNTLVAFGVTPTFPATGYGYLELGKPMAVDGATGPGAPGPVPGAHNSAKPSASTQASSPPAAQGTGRQAASGTPVAHASAITVTQYREKPDAATAQRYLAAGPDRYLWNAGMFAWRPEALLDCARRYEPATYAGLERIAAAWHTPARARVLAEVYPSLKKISVDYAVMEPASRDPKVQVAAVPMPLQWMDVGSWPSFAATCPHDEFGNALAAPRHVLLDTRNTLVASNDPNHLITTIGCEGLVIVHTPDATLVCRADRAEDIKKLHALVGEKFGKGLL